VWSASSLGDELELQISYTASSTKFLLSVTVADLKYAFVQVFIALQSGCLVRLLGWLVGPTMWTEEVLGVTDTLILLH
jgi:hypothetical protein